MIKTKEIRARITQHASSPYRFVGRASDFDAALDQLKASPSAFVLPSKKIGGADRMMTGAVVQHITAQFSIVTGVDRIGAAGGEHLDLIEDYEAALIDILVGWQPVGVTEPFTYVGGQMIGVDVDKGVMFWGSDFAAGYWLRKGESA